MKIQRCCAPLLALLLLEGCARAASPLYPPSPGEIQALPARYDACVGPAAQCSSSSIQLLSQRDTRRSSGPEILLTGPLAGAPAVSRRSRSPLRLADRIVSQAVSGPKPPPSAPSATPTPGAGERRELIDLEAHLSVEVREAREAARAVRALTASAGGEVVNEAFEDDASSSGSALSIRVPSERAEWLIARIGELGKLRSLKTQANELSRRIADADTVLDNLQGALARYQELLQHAQSAHEMTEIEKELERVRLSIDRVNTDLEWMKDRVARSTVYVQLALPRDRKSVV